MCIDKESNFRCDLHPHLELVDIPRAGLGFRATKRIPNGTVLLTESSFCSGPLTDESNDEAAVAQFLERLEDGGLWEKFYTDRLWVGGLTVATVIETQADISSQLFDRSWIQACLDNNMYQCRREPARAALFVALARFNHSCNPSALADASGDMARVRAVRDIAPGEEVTISYVPVGKDLQHRTAALQTFGFVCGCRRCVRERQRDPSWSTPCTDCWQGVCTLLERQGKTWVVGDDDRDEADEKDARVVTPCQVCGSSSALEGMDAMERHAAVVATNESLQDLLLRSSIVDSQNKEDTRTRTESLITAKINAEAALLLAPFTTHPQTLELHRTLTRVILLIQKLSGCHTKHNMEAIMEQLREIQRLQQAHSGAHHRDLNFLRCFARLVRDVNSSVESSDSLNSCDFGDAFSQVSKHIRLRWRNLCLLHFGETDAPETFLDDIDNDDTVAVVHYIPIGNSGERIAMLDGDDEIDLSGQMIGDMGCEVLCVNLSLIPQLSGLDLDSNGLSYKGACFLAAALATGAVPLLTQLDLMCNNIGVSGALVLSAALKHCPLLTYLDLHGNAICDDGALALVEALSVGVPGGGGCQLKHLNLSANNIDNRGCAALSSLLVGDCNRTSALEHLDLSENVFENCSTLLDTIDDTPSPLQHLDLSWNCITDFEALIEIFTRTKRYTALTKLMLNGNELSDRECEIVYSKLKQSGATPMLKLEENAHEKATLVHEDEEDELCLQQCLRSLADGTTINPKVCAEMDIWNNDNTKATLESPTDSTELSDCGSRRRSLQKLGFFVVPRLFHRWQTSAGNTHYSMDKLASTIHRLELAQWPPVFCFMCDAVWDLIANRLWDEIRPFLGDDCVLEQSVFAWSLKPKTASGKDENRVGQSFGLPHRDYPASEALGDDGTTPNLLTVWIPVTDATLDNGCMYVVPKEFDTHFNCPEDFSHMRSATHVRGSGVSKLRFPIGGARALPAPAGSLLVWNGNTIHWGSSCTQYSTSPPRKSIAMTFLRRSSSDYQTGGIGAPITQDDARAMSPNMRLSLIARSLLLYNQWHTLKSSAVPSMLYDVTRT